jgi:hypothetical protein
MTRPESPIDEMIFLNAKNQIDFIAANYNCLQIVENEKGEHVLLISNENKSQYVTNSSIPILGSNVATTEPPRQQHILKKRILTENKNVSNVSTKKRIKSNKAATESNFIEGNENFGENDKSQENDTENSKNENQMQTLLNTRSGADSYNVSLSLKGDVPSNTNVFDFAYSVVENIFDKSELITGYFSQIGRKPANKKLLNAQIVKGAIKARFNYNEEQLKFIWKSLVKNLNLKISNVA